MVVCQVCYHACSLLAVLAVALLSHILQVIACLAVVVALVVDTSEVVACVDDVCTSSKLLQVFVEALGGSFLIASCVGQLSSLIGE